MSLNEWVNISLKNATIVIIRAKTNISIKAK